MADAKQSTPLSALPAEINDWMSNERYSRYFHHYHEMQRWMRDYVSSWKLNRSQGTSDPVDGQHQYHISGTHRYDPYSSQYNSPVYNSPSYTTPSQHTPHRGSKHKHKSKSKHGLKKSHHQRNREEDEMEWSEGGAGQQQDDDEGFELEVSEEMKQFFAKSEDFRRKRDEAKQSSPALFGESAPVNSDSDTTDKAGASKGEKRVSGDRKMTIDDVQVKTSAPKERPGVRRIAEMKELYGRHAATIHGMETAMQLQFDRNCDRKQSAYWPIVPLKM